MIKNIWKLWASTEEGSNICTEFCVQFYWAQQTMWYDLLWGSKLTTIDKKVLGDKVIFAVCGRSKKYDKNNLGLLARAVPYSLKPVISKLLITLLVSLLVDFYICLFVCFWWFKKYLFFFLFFFLLFFLISYLLICKFMFVWFFFPFFFFHFFFF